MSKSVKYQQIAACRSVYNHATGKISAYAAMAQTACDEARKLGVVSLAAECAKPKPDTKKPAERTVAKSATVAVATKKRKKPLTDSIVGALDRFALMSSASLGAKDIVGLLKEVGVHLSARRVGAVCRKLYASKRIARAGKGQYRSAKVKR